jgi:RimJ/RimL family protein N-acetyltransferase
VAAPRFETARLIGIAGTAVLARADASDRDSFVRMLGAVVTDEWPTADMRDVQDHFARQLETGAAAPGWMMWYLLARGAALPQLVGAALPRLVGAVGHYGAPTSDGWVTIGYGICPSDEGQGYASEGLAGMIDWGRAAARLAGWRATTFERHGASVRVLEKNGFNCMGVSPDDAEAADADRQGRGRLMNWERRNS